MRPKLVLAANDGWNIINYRKGLIEALQNAGYEISVIAPDGPHAASIRQLGVHLCPISMSPRGTSPIGDLRLFGRYFHALKHIRPVAFLGFTAKPNIYGSLAARICGIPAINNVSGLGTAFTKENWLTSVVSSLYRIALARSATVFFQNPEDRALFEKKGLVTKGRGQLLPGSGVDLAYFAPRKRLPGQPFTFLLAARLLWAKGVREYVEAARRVRSTEPQVRFQILGIIEPESPAAVGRREVEMWQEAGLVEYLGATDDVRPAYSDADCVVLPSYYREGVPRVLLEASAMSIPVITTDTPGCREAVDDGKTGFLCEPRSADSLTKAMTRIMAMMPAGREKMGQAGREKMQREFREELVHSAYLEALGKLGLSVS